VRRSVGPSRTGPNAGRPRSPAIIDAAGSYRINRAPLLQTISVARPDELRVIFPVAEPETNSPFRKRKGRCPESSPARSSLLATVHSNVARSGRSCNVSRRCSSTFRRCRETGLPENRAPLLQTISVARRTDRGDLAVAEPKVKIPSRTPKLRSPSSSLAPLIAIGYGPFEPVPLWTIV